MRKPSGLLFAALLCLLAGCNVITVNRQLTLRSYARLEIRPQERELHSGRMRYYAGGQGFPVGLIHGFGFTALEFLNAPPRAARD